MTEQSKDVVKKEVDPMKEFVVGPKLVNDQSSVDGTVQVAGVASTATVKN